MKKELSANSTNVNIDELPDHLHVDYSDGDILFIDNFHDFPGSIDADNTVHLNMVAFIICLKGRMSIRIKNQRAELLPNQVACLTPTMHLAEAMMSPDFEAKIMALSPELIRSILRADKQTWMRYMHVMQNPIFDISEESMQLLSYYHRLIKFRLHLTSRYYRKQAISALVCASLYDMIAQRNEEEPLVEPDENILTQSDMLFKRFLELLASKSPVERSVKFYAHELCVTPKYLSSAVSRISGKSAMKWITSFVVEDIKRQLLYSSLSIKEISDSLGFANLSFFGKYVKQHLGCSPTEFRRRSLQE